MMSDALNANRSIFLLCVLAIDSDTLLQACGCLALFGISVIIARSDTLVLHRGTTQALVSPGLALEGFSSSGQVVLKPAFWHTNRNVICSSTEFPNVMECGGISKPCRE